MIRINGQFKNKSMSRPFPTASESVGIIILNENS